LAFPGIDHKAMSSSNSILNILLIPLRLFTALLGWLSYETTKQLHYLGDQVERKRFLIELEFKKWIIE